MATTQGTWGPQTGFFGFINPFSRDYGVTEKSPLSYTAPNTFVNPNQNSYSTPPSGTPNITNSITNGTVFGATDTQNPYGPNPNEKVITGDKTVVNPNPNPNPQPQLPSGPSDQELNNAYNPIFEYLNLAESNVRGAYPGIQSDINKQYDLSQGTLSSGRQQGFASLDQNATKVQQTKEDAMSQARRLYNELMQGYGQRFGGSSSAGEAARVLAGNEAQRTMGGVQRDAGNNLALINQKRVEVEQNYQNGLLQIQATRDAALNQAQRDFQQKLLDISNTRAATASEKAQQKLSALQELRNQAYNIQLQNQQFQQQLQLQRQSDTSALSEYEKLLSSSMGAGQQAQAGYNPTVASSLQTAQNGINGGSSMVGIRSNKDEFQGAISPQQSIYSEYEKLFKSPFSVPLTR
jgi:hypothetical protein